MNPTRLAAAGVLSLVVLAPAIFAAAGGANGTGLSPALADAPAGLVTVAFEAGQLTGIDGNVLLAIARVECDYGRCRSGQPDDLVPDDVRAHVDAAALQPGGSTATLLGLPDGRRIGDWVNPQPVADGEHAMGLMQFLPSTWRTEAAAAPGRRAAHGWLLPPSPGDRRGRWPEARPPHGASRLRRQPGLR